MRTWRFHRDCPEGRIFDTEPNMPDPLVPPDSAGWVDTPARLGMTREQAADKMVENAVKAELAAQGKHRDELEREHKKKYGEAPDMRATNDEIANVMDNKTPDGAGKIPSKFFSRRGGENR